MDLLKVFLWIALMLIIVGFVGLMSFQSFHSITLSPSISAPPLSTIASSSTESSSSDSGDKPDPKWPKAGQNWTNSLGVQMVPAGTDGVLFSVFDVRLEDFQRFATQTNLPVSSENMYTYIVTKNANGDGGATSNYGADSTLSWQNPGFYQGPTEPVVGVSWDETQLFCEWLTQKERSAGLIGPNQRFRLPKVDEWQRAVGNSTYPWGDHWPPRPDDGNFWDLTWQRDTQHYVWRDILQVNDGYAFTSPVGTYNPNDFGLYDMGGNVFQLSDDPDPNNLVHKLWRGSSWCTFRKEELRSDCTRNSCGPSYRYTTLGFRVVLDMTDGN